MSSRDTADSNPQQQKKLPRQLVQYNFKTKKHEVLMPRSKKELSDYIQTALKNAKEDGYREGQLDAQVAAERVLPNLDTQIIAVVREAAAMAAANAKTMYAMSQILSSCVRR